MPLKWGLFYSVSHLTFFRFNSCESPTYVVSWEVAVQRLVMSNTRDPADGSPQVSFVHGISEAGILEWAAISFSRSSWPRFKPMSPALQVDSLLLSLVSQSQQIPSSSQDEHGGRAALQPIARIKAFFFFFPAMDQFSFLSVEPQIIYFRLILLLLSTCVCVVTFIKNNIND